MPKEYSNDELINIAKQHSHYFSTVRGWDLFARENNLPRSNIYKNRFSTWNDAKYICEIKINDSQEKRLIQRKKILSEVSPYRNQITTAKSWNKLAKRENLTSTHTIVYYFDKWNNFKKELGIFIEEDEKNREKRAKYIDIAKQHISEFSKSAERWKKYSTLNDLPSTNTYIENFGTWANAQSLAGVDSKLSKNYTNKYDKDYLIRVAKENISYFKHTSEWERFAKVHNMPGQHAYIRAFGSMENAKKELEIIGIPTRKNYSKKELIQIALEHISHFTTQIVWDRFARENNLPKSRTFANAFDTWKESKEFIHQLYENRAIK